MDRHLSELALDELALGFSSRPENEAHLAGCESCRQRLERIRAELDEARRSPALERVKARLDLAAPTVAPRRFRRASWVLVPLLSAAVLAVVLLSRFDAVEDPPSVRAKGSLALHIAPAPSGDDADEGDGGEDASRHDGRPTEWNPGDAVVLRVSANGHAHVLVLAVDDSGDVTQVWPPGERASGDAPRGASVPLLPAFTVTEGSATLLAFFSEEPIDADGAIARWAEAIANAPEGAEPRVVVPPTLPGERGRARTELVVRGGEVIRGNVDAEREAFTPRQ